MDDNLDQLVIDVRASTGNLAADLQKVRSSIDNSLIDGLEQAGSSLERGLLSALRKGTLGFDDLRRVAMRSLNEIAAQALDIGIGNLFGGQSGGLGGLLGQSLGALLGLPGRATGGPVSPGRGYVVGERGPELFVPTSAGRVESNRAVNGLGRDVRVAISMTTPRGSAAPVAMRRSSRQLASAVRQAIEAA